LVAWPQFPLNKLVYHSITIFILFGLAGMIDKKQNPKLFISVRTSIMLSSSSK
jgi:hypothetical protein